jgi:hypothetical protein
MALAIHNVKGDGHCFYRCIWRIVRGDEATSEIIYLIDKIDEDAGMQEIRDFVAIAVRRDYTLEDMMSSLLEFKKLNMDDMMEEHCPILEFIKPELSLRDNCEIMAIAIENTSMYASSVEVEVIIRIFKEVNVGLVIVSWDTATEDKDDVSEKWLYQLQKKMAVTKEDKICILVNIDNIHYKFAMFRLQHIFQRSEFVEYIDQMLDDSNDSNDSD